MLRIVLDTNILVASSWKPASASRRLVDACRRGEFRPVLSAGLRREYELMLTRGIRTSDGRQATADIIACADVIEPSSVPRVVADPEDDKVVALAVAATAAAIVTSDQPLLALDPYEGVRILRPCTFFELWHRHAGVIGDTGDSSGEARCGGAEEG